MLVGVVICLAALFAGCTMGLAMGGFGICAVGFSAGLVGSSAIVGALFGGTMSLLWRKAWWAGALAFSAPSLLGVAFGASRESGSVCWALGSASWPQFSLHSLFATQAPGA